MQPPFRMTRRNLLRSFAFAPLGGAAGLNGASTGGEDRAIWNNVFTNEDAHLSYYPNRFLAEVVQGRKPGRVLDIGMGQGRNSLYLARLGWEVTGVDVSDKGVDIARKQAARLGLKIQCIVCDFAENVQLNDSPKALPFDLPGSLFSVESSNPLSSLITLYRSVI